VEMLHFSQVAAAT